MRIAFFLFMVLLTNLSPARAEIRPLRHMEYLTTAAADGRTAQSRVALDLLDTSADNGVTVDLTQNGESIVLDVDKHGTMTSSDLVPMSPEATMLVYFFALGSQNLAGLDSGERWSADGTDYHIVDVRDGRFEIEFARAADRDEGTTAFHGRLTYDVQKVVPIAFDAQTEVAPDGDAGPPRVVHVTAKLLSDSQT
jgi:hypothetical protein